MSVKTPLMPHTNEPRGFAFVTYRTREAGNCALQSFNNSDLGGRRLRIEESRRKTSYAKSPGVYLGPEWASVMHNNHRPPPPGGPPRECGRDRPPKWRGGGGGGGRFFDKRDRNDRGPPPPRSYGERSDGGHDDWRGPPGGRRSPPPSRSYDDRRYDDRRYEEQPRNGGGYHVSGPRDDRRNGGPDDWRFEYRRVGPQQRVYDRSGGSRGDFNGPPPDRERDYYYYDRRKDRQRYDMAREGAYRDGRREKYPSLQYDERR